MAKREKKQEEFVAAGFVGGGSRERFVFEVTVDVIRNAITCPQQMLINQAHSILDEVLERELGSDAIWLKVKLLKCAEKLQ